MHIFSMIVFAFCIFASSTWAQEEEPLAPQIELPPARTWSVPHITEQNASDILDKHLGDFLQMPGVEEVAIGPDGITVWTDNPQVVPADIEGVPTIIFPIDHNRVFIKTNHTQRNFLSPFVQGGIAGADELWSGVSATLAPAVVTEGKPYILYTAHGLYNCEYPPACPQGTPLEACDHTPPTGPTQTSKTWLSYSPFAAARRAGIAIRWEPIASGKVLENESAVAFLDDDTVDGNGSLTVSRILRTDSTDIPTFVGGGRQQCNVGNTVWMVSSISEWHNQVGALYTAPHTVKATVDFCNDTLFLYVRPGETSVTDCADQILSLGSVHQVRFVTPMYILPGTSGAVIVGSSGKVMGQMETSPMDCMNPECTITRPTGLGYAYDAYYLQRDNGFVGWYGTDWIDSTIGVFRDGNWFQDNGDGIWNGTSSVTPNTPTLTKDATWGFGLAGDYPVTGDWNGDGTVTMGIYRPSQGMFILSDYNANYLPGTSFTMIAGNNTYRPFSGNWNFSDPFTPTTKTHVGLFYTNNCAGLPNCGQFWWLDDGDFVYQGTSPPETGFITSWTQPGDIPFTGDWNGDGSITIGVYRPSNGTFYLSNTNITLTSPAPTLAWTIPFGWPGDKPAVGIWSGNMVKPRTNIGIYRGIGSWVLSTAPPGQGWRSCARDRCNGLFGLSGDIPVTFGKSLILGN